MTRSSRWLELIEGLTAEWDPKEFTDEYREALQRIVEAKINGEEIEVVEAEPTAKVVDLMEALKASVAAAKKQTDADDVPLAARRSPPPRSPPPRRRPQQSEEVDREEGDRSQEGRRE